MEIVYITKLRIILQSKLFYVLLLLFVVLYLFLCIKFDNSKSIFSLNDTNFDMEVNDYEINDDHIKLTLCNEECIVGNYYFKDITEVDDIKYGSLVNVSGSLSIPNNNTVPKGFNYKKYLNNKGIYYVIKIDSLKVIGSDVSFINDIRNYINDKLDSFDNTGYVKAFVLGINDDIDEEEYSKYQVIGVTHLFALSGMHIGVIVLLLSKLFGRVNFKVRYLIIDIFLVIYGFVLYFPASLKRTILFYIVNSIFKIFNIKVSSIKVLIIVFSLLVINDYRIIYDIGFIYSITTVGGILYSSDFVKSNNELLSSFKLSIVAFLFSLPISLYYFYSVNVLSIIYNVFYIFFVSSVVYPLSLIVFIIPKLYFIYEFIIRCLVFVTDILSKIDGCIIYIDLNMIEIILFYVVLLLFIKYRKKIYLFMMFLVLLIDILIPFFDKSLYVYFFDVDQGDCSLIIMPYREEVIMIDTGGVRNKNVSDNVISFLKSKGIKRISSLIISHGDYDHMGDASNIVRYIGIDKVIFNKDSYNELELELIELLRDEGIDYYRSNEIKEDELLFLDVSYYDNENDNSSVIYFKYDSYDFLFMGDAGIGVEDELIQKYELNNIDVLKVGHHGSKTSSGFEFIDEIKPSYSVISVGRKNGYGHPSKEVLNNLEESVVYRTDEDGSVLFEIWNDKIYVEKYMP